ncbi:4-oxalocrotonate tautomerase [Lacicoccus alkaliphilus]|uniref:Tautomerase n=1 Tax=Lacicoccus alkaliphilus DSM 16010 TaxID=1123231 RepID=A0A1M7H0T3_9BACL|nr:4-oxalocrotonate tautomerase [Salinicoccus alkaliphilus]SHM22195.1 4-oxalocrotonate tautomerase [Salinicoccus alkaliphilus DSM 16010]
MPLINIKIMEGRSEEKVEALMKRVTDAVSESIEAPKENVRVTVEEVPKTHWAIGGTSAKKLGR